MFFVSEGHFYSWCWDGLSGNTFSRVILFVSHDGRRRTEASSLGRSLMTQNGRRDSRYLLYLKGNTRWKKNEKSVEMYWTAGP